MVKKKNKYNYYKVIQENWAGIWEDVDFHETDSNYCAKNLKDLKVNIRTYRENSLCAIRVISRKEINKTE